MTTCRSQRVLARTLDEFGLRADTAATAEAALGWLDHTPGTSRRAAADRRRTCLASMASTWPSASNRSPAGAVRSSCCCPASTARPTRARCRQLGIEYLAKPFGSADLGEALKAAVGRRSNAHRQSLHRPPNRPRGRCAILVAEDMPGQPEAGGAYSREARPPGAPGRRRNSRSRSCIATSLSTWC